MTPKKRAPYGTGTKPAQRKDGLWVARIEAGWTPQGTRRRITVSAKTESACRTKLKEKQRELAAGKDHGLNVRETVRSWSLTWLPMHARKVRPTTYTTDAGAIRKWIVPTLGHRRLADLNPGDLRALRDAITNPDQPGGARSTTTALHAHKILVKMLKDAVIEGHNVPQRVREAPMPAKAVNDRMAIPLPDALKILQHVTADDGPRWVSALLQGMRQGETLGLTWDAVDFDAERIDVSWQLQTLPYLEKRKPSSGFRVPDGFEARHLTGPYHLTRPKTARGRRIIPLVDWMSAALELARERWEPNPWGLVWTDHGQPIRDETDRDRWYALQDAAEVKHPSGRPYYLHEARHATASLLLSRGVDRSIIEAIMGHVVLVEAYIHVDDSDVRRALDGLAGAFGLTSLDHPKAALPGLGR